MAPRPDLFESCAKAVEMINDLPPILRDDPDIRAVIYADARETERQEQAINELIGEFFPQTATATGLPLIETLLRLTVATSAPIPKRQEVVLGALRKLHLRMTGLAWQDAVSLLLGTNSWSYREHDPADPTSPAAYVLRLAVPYSAAEFDFAKARELVRTVTPAHLDIEIVSTATFVLGTGELGVDAL